MPDKTLMILGLGGVGSYAALLAGRLPGIKIVVGDVREEFAKQFVHNIRYDVFFQQDYFRFPEVEGIVLDMTDTSAIEAALERYRPDVVFNASTLFSWWHIHKLPHHLARKLYYAAPEGTGLRPWAPGHGALLYNLMKGVKKVLPQSKVVNVSGPDYLHEILGKIGLAPTTGVGNVALFEPILKSIIARHRNTSMASINLTMVIHHCMCMQLFQEGSCPPEIPYYFKIEEDGKDITGDFDIAEDLWAKIPEFMPVNSGVHQEFVAATAIQVIKGLLFDTGYLVHAPGAEGLPGGCPVRVDASGAKVVIPQDLSREEFLNILYKSNYLEGFEKTQADGTATATPHTIKFVEETLDMEWKYKNVRPDQMMAAQKEITDTFLKFLSGYEQNT